MSVSFVFGFCKKNLIQKIDKNLILNYTNFVFSNFLNTYFLSIMSKTTTKKKTKRIIVDYSQNLNLEYILSQLENIYFQGLSKSEITKLAIIQLFKNETDGFVADLSDEEEKSLAKAMESQDDDVSIPEGVKLSDFLLKEE
jgi:hypothetical protein